MGNYRLSGLLGRGGMSAVYRAKDTILGRDVALKVLPADMAASRPQRFDQFLKEAQSAARLDHPNVVTIYHVDQFQGNWYVVMELVDGKSLKEVLETSGVLPIRKCVQQMYTVAGVLGKVHERGILHRDIKPSNIMLTRQSVVKVTDFGLAAEWDVEVRRGQTQRAVGTPLYMAPELCYGHPPTPSTDMYALGMTMYVLLTGHKPFAAGDVMETFRNQVSAPIPDARLYRGDCPESLQKVIAKLLAKDPRDRYEWVDVMMADLQAILEHPHSELLPSDAVPAGTAAFSEPTPSESAAALPISDLKIRPLSEGITSAVIAPGHSSMDLQADMSPSADGLSSLGMVGSEAQSPVEGSESTPWPVPARVSAGQRALPIPQPRPVTASSANLGPIARYSSTQLGRRRRRAPVISRLTWTLLGIAVVLLIYLVFLLLRR